MILGILPHTASVEELVWTIIATVGLVFSVKNLSHAVGDLRAIALVAHLAPWRQTARRLVAKASLVVMVALLCVQTVFVAIGVLALCLPQPPARHNIPEAQRLLGYVFEYGFIASGVALVLVSCVTWELRRRLDALGPTD